MSSVQVQNSKTLERWRLAMQKMWIQVCGRRIPTGDQAWRDSGQGDAGNDEPVNSLDRTRQPESRRPGCTIDGDHVEKTENQAQEGGSTS